MRLLRSTDFTDKDNRLSSGVEMFKQNDHSVGVLTI